MSYDTTKLINLDTLKTTVTRIKTEYLQAISQSGHAKFQQADAIPTADTAEENVLYLVMNADTQHYDIYALVDGAVLLLDDTTVNLDDYVTQDDLDTVTANVFSDTKTHLEDGDSAIIEAYFDLHDGDDDPTPKQGDVFVINTVINDTAYEQSAYSYDGTDWLAMTGCVDAEKVIMRGDITMAGNYTQVGNKTKTTSGTAEFSTAGKSVADILTEIFTATLQPTITAAPSVSGFTLSGAGTVEAGTALSSVSLTAATLNDGTYTYGPDPTGVVASAWAVSRVTSAGTVAITNLEAASLPADTDDNDGAGFVIGDEGGDSTVSSLKYTVTATHSAGDQALDNLGGDSSPAVAIASGTKSKTTSAYTPYRNYFYGASTSDADIDSDFIRSLTKSNKAYTAGSVTISVPAGTTRICIACLATKTGVTLVVNETSMGADVTSTFVQTTVDVEGANGYTAVSYKVWTYEPAVAYENAATLTVTLG